MTLDTRLLPPKPSFKERYRPDWGYSVMCEATVFINLKQLFGLKNIDILRLGKGVMTTEVVNDPTHSPTDFYIPKLRLFVEVSSSKLSQFESYCRCMKLKDVYDRAHPRAR
jgi:hypothetical protein